MASEETLLEKIKKYLENEEGDLEMKVFVFREEDLIVEGSVCRKEQDYKINLGEKNECEVKHHAQKDKENKYIFILFCNNILSYYVSLSLKGTICYIDKLDSTGYIKGIAKDFVKSILSTVNKEIICCFSHPKPSFIFNLNSKNILNSHDLACFWIEIFKTKCDKIQVWSNNFNELKRNHPNITKGYPYKTKEDLEYFQDDPKTRIREKLDVNLEKMFEIMLCRNDFIEGSLVYGTNKNIGVDDLYEIERSNHSITKYLQGLDLSTEDKLINESRKFLEKFNIEFVDFKYKKKEKFVKKKEEVVVLSVKRRRK